MKQQQPFTFAKKLNYQQMKKLAIALVIVVIAAGTYIQFLAPHTLEAKQRLQLESTQRQLLETEQSLQQQKATSQQSQAEKQKQLDQLNQQLKDTQQKLEAKLSVPKTDIAAAAPVPQPVVQSYSVPTDQAKAFIYSHESGNRPNAINASSGACGLGQALPCSKMPCSLSDYACQDNFFTQYMLQRYGSWQNAMSFWQAHKWW